MWRQPNIILYFLITNLLKEEVLMKILNNKTNISTLYVGKRPYSAKGRIQRVGPPFFQWSLKCKDNFNLNLQVITQDLNHPKRKLGVLDVRKWVMELNIT
jgi:hypothetical protein